MTESSHSPLQSLFEAALEQAPSQRNAWIEAQCADPKQRALLAAMLEADALTAQVLGTPAHLAADMLSAAVEPFDVDRLVGSCVGPFRVERLIGRGGMASVFLAYREGADFDQAVALKVLQRGLYSAVEQRLFRRERRALAALEHPNIARLIDGGVTDAGIPFLAMEYVDGLPITQYCTHRQLSLRARLDLFLTVCHAVDAAHRALIVHRDIKPSNILVTLDGNVKLLDFGIAKLLDQEGDETTHAGLSAMTPQYAAPEQLAGTVITTATDVYSLGILIHEMLLGERPDRDAPRRPSSCITEVNPDPWTLPSSRATLRGKLKGDLDNIVLKALESEPARRYPSAGALAEDIAHHLAGRPVNAHPPSAWYRTQKFIQRHRGGVALTALLVLAVFASLFLALWQGAEARRQAQRAQQQTELAQAESQRAQRALAVSESVQEFLLDLFDAAIPDGPKEQQPSLQDIVRNAEARVREGIDEAPEVRHEIYRRLIAMYDALGDTSSAIRVGDEAAKFSAAAFGAGSDKARIAEFDVVIPRYRRGDPDALKHMEALVVASIRQGWVSIESADQMLTLGAFLSDSGRGDEGIAMVQKAATMLETLCIPDSKNDQACRMRATALNNLGTVQFGLRQFAAARDSFDAALRLEMQVSGPDHRKTGRTLGNLALVEGYLGQRESALKHIQQAIRIGERIGNQGAATVPAQRTTLALLLAASGRKLDVAKTLADAIASAPPDTAADRAFSLLRLNYAKSLLELGTYVPAAEQIAMVRPDWEADAAANRNHLARMHEVLAVIAAEHDRDPERARDEIDAAIAQRRLQQPVPVSDLVSTLSIAHRLALLAGAQDRAARFLAKGEDLVATNAEMTETTRSNWIARRFDAAIAVADLAAAEKHMAEYAANVEPERPSARFDRLQLMRLKLAEQRHTRSNEVNAAWLADLRRRSGDQAPIYIEARDLLRKM